MFGVTKMTKEHMLELNLPWETQYHKIMVLQDKEQNKNAFAINNDQ
jgi:hypothetical protein